MRIHRSLIVGILCPIILSAAEPLHPRGECAKIMHHVAKEDRDPFKLRDELIALSENGDSLAMFWLARMYFKGREVYAKDEKKALALARKSWPAVKKLADTGDLEAEFLVAAAYHEGLGVPIDYTRAVTGYLRPAEAGHIVALLNRGICFRDGDGTPPDIVEARKHLQRAADLGSRSARRIVRSIRDMGRDDSKRLETLLSMPLAQTLGRTKKEGLEILLKAGLIKDLKGLKEESMPRGATKVEIPASGIRLYVTSHDHIKTVEALAPGWMGSTRHPDKLPFGLKWDASIDDCFEKAGFPDSNGRVPGDNAYGAAFFIDRLNFALIFPNDAERRLKIIRMIERWSVASPNK